MGGYHIANTVHFRGCWRLLLDERIYFLLFLFSLVLLLDSSLGVLHTLLYPHFAFSIPKSNNQLQYDKFAPFCFLLILLDMVVAMLVIVAEICLLVLSFLVFIAFIYQIRVKESDSKMSLQLNDPEVVVMRNLFASMYSLVPGLARLTGFMSSSTKSE